MSTTTPMIEDFINVLNIDTTHDSALAVKVACRHDTIGLDAQQTSTDFCATVTARTLPEDDESARAPVDIVIALDVSGSMNGRKLEMCKDTLTLLLRELSSQDRFGLVTFGDTANLEIPTRKLTETNKDAALSKIKSLYTSGCTNMSGGIGLAAQELQAVESPHEVRTIFLLTDGHANRGISERSEIVSLTKSCLGASLERREIAIHCFGYGVDHDREMLGDISKATEGGSYYFVDSDSDVSSAFGDALGGVLSIVAQNTCVKIKAVSEAPGLGVSILNVKHDKAVKNPDESYSISLGDFYAEESRDIVVETTLGRNGTAIDVPHITVEVSYLDTINKKFVSSPAIVGSIARPSSNTMSKTNTHVALQCIRIKTTQIISEAEALAESNNLAKARSTISEYIQEVQKEAALLEESTNAFIVQVLSELNTMLSGLSSRSEYMSSGSKYMQCKIASHSYQRCFESSETTMNVHRGSRKAAMSKKMKMFSMTK